MRLFLTAILTFVLSSKTFSNTVWISDRLDWGAASFSIMEFPLDKLLTESENTFGNFLRSTIDTSNPKGYVARWVVVGDRLYLRKFDTDESSFREKAIDTMKLHKLPKFADWYSGYLTMPFGNLNSSSGIREFVIRLKVESGVVVSKEVLKDVIPNEITRSPDAGKRRIVPKNKPDELPMNGPGIEKMPPSNSR